MKKRLLNMLFVFCCLGCLFGGTVLAEDVSSLNFCDSNGIKLAFKIVGYAIFAVKIIIPIVLIIYGTIDVSKAVIDGKEDALRKSLGTFAKRSIAAILIFIAPTVINGLFNSVIGSDYENGTKSDYKNCFDCLFSPNDNTKCKVQRYGE